MTDTITMSFDEWVEEFKPVQNHIDKNASIGGLMFETYGKELEFVRTQEGAACVIIRNLLNAIIQEAGQNRIRRLRTSAAQRIIEITRRDTGYVA